jgi:hypothetical protein
MRCAFAIRQAECLREARRPAAPPFGAGGAAEAVVAHVEHEPRARPLTTTCGERARLGDASRRSPPGFAAQNGTSSAPGASPTSSDTALRSPMRASTSATKRRQWSSSSWSSQQGPKKRRPPLQWANVAKRTERGASWKAWHGGG